LWLAVVGRFAHFLAVIVLSIIMDPAAVLVLRVTLRLSHVKLLVLVLVLVLVLLLLHVFVVLSILMGPLVPLVLCVTELGVPLIMMTPPGGSGSGSGDGGGTEALSQRPHFTALRHASRCARVAVLKLQKSRRRACTLL